MSAQSAEVVPDCTWIGPIEPLEARLAKVQFNVCAPTAPVIEQPLNAGVSDQFRSPPTGSGSEICTLVAVPAPVFETEISKPMFEPALTGPTGFAVFEM